MEELKKELIEKFGKDCPNKSCNNTGCYPDHGCNGTEEDCQRTCPVPVQCEFCYIEPLSKFNLQNNGEFWQFIEQNFEPKQTTNKQQIKSYMGLSLTINEWGKEFGVSILDPDGFDRTDSKLYKRLMSRDEFLMGLERCTISGGDYPCVGNRTIPPTFQKGIIQTKDMLVKNN